MEKTYELTAVMDDADIDEPSCVVTRGLQVVSKLGDTFPNELPP
jgi:hypothetical protein